MPNETDVDSPGASAEVGRSSGMSTASAVEKVTVETVGPALPAPVFSTIRTKVESLSPSTDAARSADDCSPVPARATTCPAAADTTVLPVDELG